MCKMTKREKADLVERALSGRVVPTGNETCAITGRHGKPSAKATWLVEWGSMVSSAWYHPEPQQYYGAQFRCDACMEALHWPHGPGTYIVTSTTDRGLTYGPDGPIRVANRRTQRRLA